MSKSRFYSVVVDCADPAALARFWQAALGWQIIDEAEDAVSIGADQDSEPWLEFVPVPEPKAVKNRLHIDLAPDDRDAEVERLISLGATHADVGQGADQTWVVPTRRGTSSACCRRADAEPRSSAGPYGPALPC